MSGDKTSRGVTAGDCGMTMRPQMKRPWSFQPWTMSLSGQYVPRVKLISGFYIPSIFLPLDVASQPIFSLFWGTLQYDHP
jgi:hypothetical protein